MTCKGGWQNQKMVAVLKK